MKNRVNMSIKIFSFILFNFFACFEMVNAQWIIEDSPSMDNLNSISFVNENTGWIVGDKGTVLTRNDGKWVFSICPVSENLYGILMLDENNGWAVGAKGTILKYNGNNWQKIESPTDKTLHSVSFKDFKNGIAVGEFGTVILYKDGRWTNQQNVTKGDLFTAVYKNDYIWIAGGIECVNIPIMKLTNKDGLNIECSTESFSIIKRICFSSEKDGWAVGSPSVLMHYDGSKWEKTQPDFKFPSLNSVYFINEKNGIFVGYEGILMIYSDGKLITETSDKNYKLNDVFITSNSYYAVGDRGTIITKRWNAKNGGKIFVDNFEEVNIYPNPCNEILTVLFSGNVVNQIDQIMVFNSIGQEVYHKDFNHVELKHFQINTANLINGLYALQVNTGLNIIERKFVIQH